MELENRQARVYLKKGRARPLKNRHRWVYSGAVDRVEGEVHPGDIVSIYSHEGRFLARGFINPHSQIRLRILSFADQPVTPEFFRQRLKQASDFRLQRVAKVTNAYRMVHAEADGLPGMVVDRYGNVLVMQLFSLGMARLRELLIQHLVELFQPEAIVEKTTGQSLEQEGLEEKTAVLYGSVPGELVVEEYGMKSVVDVLEGQKTGLFLDQRENRRRVKELSRPGQLVLNCFSYLGGFSIAAALAGARTVSVEISESAQQMARKNFRLNGLDEAQHQFVVANVFDFLREDSRLYDLVVLDPPAFVKKQRHLQRGLRGYKDINRLGLLRVKSEGLLLTCSCSHYVNWDLFQKVVFAAAAETDREVQIIGRFAQPEDHPVSIFHPEGEYLKCFLLRVYDAE